MKCLHDKCLKQSEKDGYCDLHYWRRKWLDNSNKNDLGIVSYAQLILPEWVRNDTADFQKEFLYLFFQMYQGKHENKYDRLLGEIGFRGAAKTTWAKILLHYICSFGLEKLVIYCSETNSFAVQDVFEVRRNLGSNELVRYFFGQINSKKVQGQDGQWNRDAFLTSTGVYVLARGVGQQVRSALRNAYRPTLVLVNDMYGKDSVKTESGRAEMKKWFFTEMFNAVDDIEGKVFFNGTILHEDTVPVVIKNNPMWKVVEHPIMSLDDFHRALSECKQTEDLVVIPSRERCDALQKTMYLAWPQRLDLRFILTKYAEAYQSRNVEGFYQEYFHVVVSPDAKPIKNFARAQMRYFRAKDKNWLAVKFSETSQEVIYPVNIYFGVDPASSTSASAKFSVIAIMMMNQHRQVFYFGYSRGRYGLRDELKPQFIRDSMDKVEMDKSRIKRVGIVDEEIRMAKFYHPTMAQIETTQAQEHIYTELGRLMRVNNANHSIVSEKPVEKKEERDADMLTPDFQSGAAFINYGLEELELEFKSFPRGSTIDIIDAFYHARAKARPPKDLSFDTMMKERKSREKVPIFEVL